MLMTSYAGDDGQLPHQLQPVLSPSSLMNEVTKSNTGRQIWDAIEYLITLRDLSSMESIDSEGFVLKAAVGATTSIELLRFSQS